MSRLVELIGKWLIAAFPGRTKHICVDGKPYLDRFFIKHNGILPGVYLHHFHQSDPDRDLHNHPWSWSFSLILAGGYYEYRMEANQALAYLEPTVYERSAPGINILSGDTFHRVVLKDLKKGAWTIFISGPEVKDWGFMSRRHGFVKHVEYLGLETPFLNVSPDREKSYANT